ncbi:MAG TPA: CopG family transcriptional regulator [Opitutaceae bacterium]|jgi:hypothetical protein|nr:MAG: hypothetical protein BWX86_00748 [Verrucomicrobia bacterium ADurb.Bin122]HOD47702.1 CopG family transcriptional regulator [Opitutaceae bacterium]HOF10896.1 CopG family transcriptional regulator [Opitutaceae bacterium]HOR24040.1 CopG family transcriptional regulator [Opitutaceae bacterium]HOY55281.1 CopG family transcriptional regulator [Opitutaceae bacterium]
MATTSAAPLTFDLTLPLIEKIATCRAALGLASTSEVVRLAISRFNFDRYQPNHETHRQISVRLDSELRQMLKRQSRAKKASIGELLRVAVDDLSVATEKKAGAKSKKPQAKAKPAAKKARRK